MREDLWEDGVWIGPRSLPVFLRANWFFVAWWLFILTGIALALWFEVGRVSSFALALPLAVVTGAAVTLALMFPFSRGWVGDGE